jgi:hypothetical protein
MIPSQLWVSISQFENHIRVPQLMSLSKSIYSAFLAQSPDIIQWYLRRGITPLPKWCWLLRPMPPGPIKEHLERHTVGLVPLALTHNGVVSGGSICQLAFGAQWTSDIDVFIEKDGPESRELINNIDHVYVNNLLNRIASFDLSICQVTVDSTHGIRCTPAFLYSLRYNAMLIQVGDIQIFYIEPRNFEPTKGFLTHIFLHHKNHETNDLHTCTQCDLSRYIDYDIRLIDKWYRRITKYQQRFPEMQRIFIEANKF